MNADLRAAQRELDSRVMGRNGVAGTAIAEHRGKPCLKVYVTDDKVVKSLPDEVAGFRIVAERTEPFRRF